MLWKEHGLTVVFVTHNVREAVTLSQRVVLMASRPGRIVAEWRVDEPYPRDPSSDEVHALEREVTNALRQVVVGV
jgi:NitT/TauT family transport system ATP-binding protein